MLDVLAEQLPENGTPRVAVLVDGGSGRLVERLRRRFPAVEVTRLPARSPAGRLHLRLAAAGPFDVILDASRQPAARGRLLRRTFWHLRRGGCYVAVRYREQERRFAGEPPPGSLSVVLTRATAAAARSVGVQYNPRRPRHRPGGLRQGDLAALGRAVEQRSERHGHLVLVNGATSLAKVAESQGDRLLRLRGGADRVLQTVPGTTFTSRCVLTFSTDSRPDHMPVEITAPPLSLRQYHAAACVPGQVLVSGGVLLPETYRHNQRRRLTNQYTVELGRRFAAVEADLENVTLLEGTYFYLDNEVRGHFGHALTEQVSALWALPAVRQHAGEVKVVMTSRRRHGLQPFERELFAAAGVAEQDLVVLEQPARVQRLLAATPTFSMPQYVHPLVARVWTDVGDALAQRATLPVGHDRIFVGRRTQKRSCLNSDEVEDLFVRHGFTLVYPEDYPLPDQVALFRRAQVVAGYAGSGLFTMCFAGEPKTVISIGSEVYTANNEYLIAAVLGHRLVTVVSGIRRTEAEESRDVKRFQSSFTVDMEREGRFLGEVLADL